MFFFLCVFLLFTMTSALCLTGPMYGQTSNRILALARIVELSDKSKQALSFDRTWDTFLRENLDLEKLGHIWKNRDKTCKEMKFTGRQAFSFEHTKADEIISEFIFPNKKSEEEARKILGNAFDVVSVHRRLLDNECYWKTASYKVSNTSCNYQLRHIKEFLNVNSTVILLSDMQDKKGDKQFEDEMKKENVRFIPLVKRSILTDYWIGIKSRLHIGNPISTVDGLIRIWKAKLKSGEYFQITK